MVVPIKRKQAGDQRFMHQLQKGTHIIVIGKLKPPLILERVPISQDQTKNTESFYFNSKYLV
jgi:hypothetical protein